MPQQGNKFATIVIEKSTQVPLTIFEFLAPLYSFSDHDRLYYVQPPNASPITVGGYNGYKMSTPSGNSGKFTFTFETITGPLAGGTGTCDTVFDMTMVKGIPTSLINTLLPSLKY